MELSFWHTVETWAVWLVAYVNNHIESLQSHYLKVFLKHRALLWCFTAYAVFTIFKKSVLLGYKILSFQTFTPPHLKTEGWEGSTSPVYLVCFCVCDSHRPLQYSERASVDAMDAIQEDQLSFQSSGHQGRGPPGSVSIWESVSLLEQITSCHILNPPATKENAELIFKNGWQLI